MPELSRHTFSKSERLCGKKDIDRLLKKGRYWRVSDSFRICFLRRELSEPREDNETSRIMVSVPKKLFKRAVKRNRIKRLVRESYRLNKGLLSDGLYDIQFIYTSAELPPYEKVSSDVTKALSFISGLS
ncbi:MAG: ribonuclease P protein component [Bacteroidales bacterium]|nr:ribonuclease P protein component [Bacteroidales bacterium]